jgi:signal peptidase I
LDSFPLTSFTESPSGGSFLLHKSLVQAVDRVVDFLLKMCYSQCAFHGNNLMFKRNNDRQNSFWHRKLGSTAGSVALFIFEVLQIVIISAAIIIPVRYFLIQPFYVKGASMEPNFTNNEYLIIDEISYRFEEPIRGDIVVFEYPKDPDQFFIKRVVGLPGETIEITGGKVLLYNGTYPNGRVLDEPYLASGWTNGKEKVTLGPDEYYVLGDNRDQSLDSRSFGPIKRDHIIGKVWFRGLPISKLGTFAEPQYNL